MKGRRRRSGSLWRVRRDGISGPQVKRGERGFLFVSNKTRRRGELLARPFFPPFCVVQPSSSTGRFAFRGGIRSGGSWQPSSQNPQKIGNQIVTTNMFIFERYILYIKREGGYIYN